VLPDGIFTYIPKSPILQGQGMENVGRINGHLQYLTVICYTLLSFGKFSGHLVYLLFHGLVCLSKKNLATLLAESFFPPSVIFPPNQDAQPLSALIYPIGSEEFESCPKTNF
jgi:hypothetical protein